MRYVIAGAAALLLNCTLGYSQATDTAVKNGSTPPQTTIAVQGTDLDYKLPGLFQIGLFPPSIN